MAVTKLNLLGGFSLRIGDGDPVVLPWKAQALATILTLHEGRPVKREVIGELLWPDRGEKQSRNSLKQDLYVLRRDGFGGQEIIVTVDNALALPPELVVCDVHRLRARIRAGVSSTWESIADLYMGPLLHGFASVSPEFDSFLLGMRRTIEKEVLDALGKQAAIATDCGATSESIAIAERILAIDPLREDNHRRLIQSYAHGGRRTDAMRIYAEAKALLRREMDVAPAAETEALIAQIREQRPVEPSWPKAATVVPGSGRSPRIAVLPLRQFLSEPLASHISSGLIADIIAQLAGLRELTVISHGSTFSLGNPGLDPGEIGRKLDARYLVVCSLHPAGDRLRLTTVLTDVETSAVFPPFNDYVDAAPTFEDQDRIVARIINQMVPQVRESELRRIRGKRPDVLFVYEKILLSRERITLPDSAELGEAKHLLATVIKEDPGYGEAYALAADCHEAMVDKGWSADPAGDEAAAERLTQLALRHDSGNVRALISYGHRRAVSHRDHLGALRLFGQALDLSPCSANAWALSGLCLAYAGDGKRAVRHVTRALELSPCDREAHKFYHSLCVAHYTNSDYEQAAEWGMRALTRKSLGLETAGFTAASLAAIGRLPEAHEIAAQMWTRNEPVNEPRYQDPDRRRLYARHLSAAGYSV